MNFSKCSAMGSMFAMLLAEEKGWIIVLGQMSNENTLKERISFRLILSEIGSISLNGLPGIVQSDSYFSVFSFL